MSKRATEAPAATEAPTSPLRVVSDGIATNTVVYVDGKELPNVMGLSWEIRPGDVSRMVVELDWIGIEYEGPYVTTMHKPTLREVLGMWWRGRMQPNRDRL